MSGTSKKMSVEAWILAGLEALEAHGFRVVKADTLSKMLNVTRGSFYWHFPEVGSFHRAVIGRWTDERMGMLNKEFAADDTSVRDLLKQAFGSGAMRERQMRLWAIEEPMARAALAEIDGRRLALMEELAVGRGLERDTASRRIKLIYWSYVGASVLEEPARDDLSIYIEELALMLEPAGINLSAAMGVEKVAAFEAVAEPMAAAGTDNDAVLEPTPKAAKPKREKPKTDKPKAAKAKPAPDMPVQQALFDF
ncbi:TetR/AcrR family transcriptional regulator [Agrobacterium sp. ES01]|uniref:TetR/AcrR family transcriptional regulator n=1 Tax=Agrobacterium sp. ES01 TaxID=3420714 RepID=UPI003D1199C5